MQSTRVLSILTALANGAHPFTGEIFPPDSPYQHPDVVRALFAAVRAIQRPDEPLSAGCAATRIEAATATALTGNAAGGGKRNAGKPWSRDEERELLHGFDAGMSVRQLAGAHGRSPAGIEARLVSLGRLELSPKLAATLRGSPQSRGAPPLPGAYEQHDPYSPRSTYDSRNAQAPGGTSNGD